MLLTIIMYRLFFHAEPLPVGRRMTPMLFILLAPTSVGFVSYTGLLVDLIIFARNLLHCTFFWGFWLALNMFSVSLRCLFIFPSWLTHSRWLLLIIASMKMLHFTARSIFSVYFQFCCCACWTVLLVGLVVRTVKSIFGAELCRPEQRAVSFVSL